jgi:hypothetical protein
VVVDVTSKYQSDALVITVQTAQLDPQEHKDMILAGLIGLPILLFIASIS